MCYTNKNPIFTKEPVTDMKLAQFKTSKWYSLALAFAIPFGAFSVLMIIMGVVPFDHYSLLYSDMYHQYFPFFKAFRQALLSGESLLYNWDVGMGIDYLGLVSYYLASPLNLLSVLVPEEGLLIYFSWLVPIKLGLASLFFAIFLKNMFCKNDLSIALFGSFYGLCAWALGYQWNIMWLDTFALLPLMALGTVWLLRDRKFILYTVVLFLSVFANYYIGFFLCIFVFMLFVCYEICRGTTFERFCADLGCIGVCTVFAIGMTAVLTLPAFEALQNTQSSVNTFPEGFAVNIVSGEAVTEAKAAWRAYKEAKEAGLADFEMWWTAMKAVIPPVLEGMGKVAGNMNGGLAPTFKEGLPNLYCGVGTIVFAFLFLTMDKVKLRDKICAVVMLLFFIVSFILRQLDYIWHGFHFTNMIPYRFSFLFSFVMLYMAYRAFALRRHMKFWQVIVAALLALGIMLLSDNSDDTVFIAYNGVFFLLYFGALVVYSWPAMISRRADREEKYDVALSRSRMRKVSGIILLSAMGIELVMCVVNFGVNFPKTNVENYPRGTEDAQAVIEYMQRQEEGLFYRAEVTHSQTLNDGALNGYHGISTFTSSANVKVTEFMKTLGYSAKNTYNRYCFEESSPVANLFLGLKYMIERDGSVEDNPYFDTVVSSGNVHLLENNAYLPLGFLAEEALGRLEFASYSNAFNFQNRLFSAATGLQEDVWTLTSGDSLTLTPLNVTIKSQSTSGYCSYTTGESGDLFYRWDVETAGFFCVDMTMNARNSFYVYHNGRLLYSESLSLPQTLSVCKVIPGDYVEIRVRCKAGENSSMTLKAAVLDDELFREGYGILSASTLQLTEFSNTKISGTINCDRDGLLYTSIPQNGENWSVYVDGAPADVVLVGDVMVGVELREGTHELVFVYNNEAYNSGLKISLVCFGLFLLAILWTMLPKLRQWLTRKTPVEQLPQPEEEPLVQPTPPASEQPQPEPVSTMPPFEGIPEQPQTMAHKPNRDPDSEGNHLRLALRLGAVAMTVAVAAGLIVSETIKKLPKK